MADIGRAIGKAAAEASDLLLVYYAGHGLVGDRGRLYLATGGTQAGAPKYSGLGVDLLREDIGNSGADARVLVLDCCFSGRAIEAMGDQQALITGRLAVAGTYDDLDDRQRLGLPRPQRRVTDTAGALALSRGRSDTDAPTDSTPEEALVTTGLCGLIFAAIGGAMSWMSAKEVYEANHALVVRLRPEVPDSSLNDMILSTELHRLGYYAIGRIGSFGAAKGEMLDALERFAGQRVVRTERESLARDPRLQPTML